MVRSSTSRYTSLLLGPYWDDLARPNFKASDASRMEVYAWHLEFYLSMMSVCSGSQC